MALKGKSSEEQLTRQKMVSAPGVPIGAAQRKMDVSRPVAASIDVDQLTVSPAPPAL